MYCLDPTLHLNLQRDLVARQKTLRILGLYDNQTARIMTSQFGDKAEL